MSTIPGDDAWRDAGLADVDPDQPRRLTDEDAAAAPAEPEDYTPPFPRPDREDRAAEADVVEQDIEVPLPADDES